MRRGILQISLFSVIMLVMACGCVRRPSGVMSDNETASVVADLQIAEAYLQTHPQGMDAEQRKEGMLAYILDKHGVSRADFDTTLNWYAHNPDNYIDMLAVADKELVKRRKKLAGSESIVHESADLWPYTRQGLISPLSNTNSLDFSIPTIDVEKGSRVEMKFRMRAATRLNMLLGVEYENGWTGYVHRDFSGNKRSVDLMVQTDSSMVVKRVFGYLSVEDRNVLPLWIDSIYMHTLPFDSVEYYNIHSQRVYKGPIRRVKPKPVSFAKDSLNSSSSVADKR